MLRKRRSALQLAQHGLQRHQVLAKPECARFTARRRLWVTAHTSRHAGHAT